MAQATSSPGGSSKTQVQAESIPPEKSQIGNPEVSSREKRRHRASLARHSRKCSVCHHPDREFIDDDYLRWLSPKKIASQYKISHHSVVYRHADATGLRTQRRASLRATLENFIEQAESVRATAGSVVAAVRLYAQINDQGQWIPAVKRFVVEHRYTTAETASPAASAASPAPVATKDALPSSSTSAAPSAAPQAQAHKHSGLADATDGFQPVATITAGSSVPFSASQDKFPAVTVASINIASDLPISNREHVELEHVATH